MPATPSNGATIRIFDWRASASLTSASRTCTLDSACSRALPLTKFLCARSSVRFRFDCARFHSARALATSASFNVASSATSNWPRLTACPSRNPICATRPATSGRRMTLSLERNEPTVCNSRRTVSDCTVTTSTVVGAAATLPAGASFALDRESDFGAAAAAPSTPIVAGAAVSQRCEK